MVRSMTGFGRGEIERQGAVIVAEVRSVNHKFCDIAVRLPKWLANFESKVRSVVQQNILRGKISVAVTWNGDESSALTLDEAVADRYVSLLRALKERYNLPGQVDLKTLVAFPDLLTPGKTPEADEESWKLMEEVLGKALRDAVSMKEAEGKTLAEDLNVHTERMLARVEAIERRVPARIREARDKLTARLRELLAGGEVPEERLAYEVVIFADKLDCTEECVRLRAHSKQFVSLVDGPELAGRKLNFLLQEMNREANTIGSKAADIEIINEVIAMKDEIEKLREQVQNVE
ncbi:MAG: YicC/YloC family endoribonuclease [Candidatus Eisenbacteria bacterium]